MNSASTTSLKKSTMNNPNAPILQTKISEGVLLVDKPRGKTSFSFVTALRRLTRIEKIGHAGTLDPFATGLMVMLIGKKFTRLSQDYLCQDKEYECKMLLGVSTDSYDCDGQITATSTLIPTLAEIEKALLTFQGTVLQTPPMYSAKKSPMAKNCTNSPAKASKSTENPSTVTTQNHSLSTTPTLTSLSTSFAPKEPTSARSLTTSAACSAAAPTYRNFAASALATFHISKTLSTGFISMITVEKSSKDIPSLSDPIALTIGFFDGVHLGHQHLFQQLKKHGTAAVLTFSNHPAEVLRPSESNSSTH